ncbi:MAG: class I SAM-dependent methyltransferase [Candidatus Erginobacter occultus]|nr:class I SAM-dependent methyltransferase [Candidatus Erginobacter occultus]
MITGERPVQDRLAGKCRELAGREFYRRYQDYWHSVMLSPDFPPPGGAVLDCGCGPGLLLDCLARRGFRVYGIDISMEMLKAARDEAAPAGLIAGSAETMGWRASSFDAVICKGSLHHLESPPRALAEIRRVLKPGGILVLSEPCRDNPVWRVAGRAVTALGRGFSSGHRVFTSRELAGLLDRTGFAVLGRRYFGLAGFALCAMAHHFSPLRFLPAGSFLAGLLIRLDEALADRYPARTLAWHLVIAARAVPRPGKQAGIPGSNLAAVPAGRRPGEGVKAPAEPAVGGAVPDSAQRL